MKNIYLLSALLLFSLAVIGQETNKKRVNYETAVSFGSMCCGTASDDFLKDFHKKFNKTNKVVIPAFIASGCGKEGEYKVLFSLIKLKPLVKKKFLNELSTLITKQGKKNRDKNSSSGTISIEKNLVRTELDFCRGGIKKWQ
ncbi:MAG: hypothetical protein WKF35_13180 [Ferruginibacter sp.]